MDSSKIIVQDNVLTSARFEYSVLERNLFYSVLKQLTKEPKHKYIISVNDLQNLTGVKNGYARYTEATMNMLGRVYEITEANGDFLQVAMFSHCRYLKGQGLIEVGMSEEIHPYLFDLKKNFTQFQLDVALGLSSKFGKRMYEILSQWKTFNAGVRTFDIIELKAMLNLYDPKTEEEQYKNWSDFEKRVLKVAQKDLMRQDINSDLSFTYKGNKQGRRYVSVTFEIKQKAFQKMIEFKEEKSKQYGILVNEFQLNPKQAEQIISQYSEGDISKVIFNIRLDITDGKVHKSVGGYAAKRFGV